METSTAPTRGRLLVFSDHISYSGKARLDDLRRRQSPPPRSRQSLSYFELILDNSLNSTLLNGDLSFTTLLSLRPFSFHRAVAVVATQSLFQICNAAPDQISGDLLRRVIDTRSPSQIPDSAPIRSQITPCGGSHHQIQLRSQHPPLPPLLLQVTLSSHRQPPLHQPPPLQITS